MLSVWYGDGTGQTACVCPAQLGPEGAFRCHRRPLSQQAGLKRPLTSAGVVTGPRVYDERPRRH